MSAAFSDKDRSDCREGERLLDLAMTEADPDEYARLKNRAALLLSPLAEKNMPDALYLYACYLLGQEGLRDEETDARHAKLIEAAAVQGHAKAQFVMGQLLDRGGDLEHDPEKSAEWFRLSAEQGFPYAQWVHGVNLLHGEGVQQNEELALAFIRRAAEGKFGGALNFMADAYAEGRYNFPIDAEKSHCWREKLKEPGVTDF